MSRVQTQRRHAPRPAPVFHGAHMLAAGLLALLAACGSPRPHTELSGKTMGTTWSVVINETDVDVPVLRARIDTRLEEIEQQMSTWRTDSELSRLNRDKSLAWVTVSPGLARVLASAQRIAQQTHGAFDITVSGLMRLWGFHGPGPAAIPEQDAIDAALAEVGMENFEVDPQRSAVRKMRRGVHLDVSGIAKGYAVDELARILTAQGLDNHLVEIGGEVRASGVRSDGRAWRVAVERPGSGGRRAERIISLAGMAVATSGDYRNYFEANGRRYTHVIDPATGYPPTHAVAAVSVVARDAMTADALATAFMVMDREATLALAEAQGLAVLLIERDAGAGFRLIASTAFQRLDENAPESTPHPP